MPDHSTHFEATSGGMILTNAILLYRSQGSRIPQAYGASTQDACAFASIHAVDQTHEDHPTIAAGVPLTRAHLRQWTEALGRSVAPELLPDNILVAHADMLAWWVPPQVRPAWFALSSPPDGLRVLHERNIVPVPYPAHLFVATRSGLGVYALPTNARPTAETRLLHSPILNVFVGGQLCWGNIPRPGSLPQGLSGRLGEFVTRSAGPAEPRGHRIVVELRNGTPALGFMTPQGEPLVPETVITNKAHLRKAMTIMLRRFAAAIPQHHAIAA